MTTNHLPDAGHAPLDQLLGLVNGWQILTSISKIDPSGADFESTFWSQRWDLNPGPAVYETAALPLSYAGSGQAILARAGSRQQRPGREVSRPAKGLGVAPP